MCDSPREDPRDAAQEASTALLGVLDLLSTCNEPVERRGIEHMLRLIWERLDPACEALQTHFVPRI